MQCPADLTLLLQKFAKAESKEEIYIKRTLAGIAELLQVSVPEEYYYTDLITRDFCRVIDMLEKRHEKEKTAIKSDCREEGHPMQFLGNRNMERSTGAMQFSCSEDLIRAFYNHFKEQNQVDYTEIGYALECGRKDLVNPTLKDYAARIYTFAGPKYLGEMFPYPQLGGLDPVLFTYENIELILATFKTRDENGQIVKQRVNIRSALRKLNEFKQCGENSGLSL